MSEFVSVGGAARPCPAPPPHVSRRKFVTHGVALGAACWVAPTIVSVPPAWANPPHSAPPRTRTTKPEPFPTDMGPPLATGLPGTLPFTGQNAKEHAELGVAALAAGAALVAVTREKRRAT